MHAGTNERQTMDTHVTRDIPRIVDDKVTLLIAAGAAMAANCEPCLNKIVPDLIEAGVIEADIRKAIEIGQFVKDKPAAIMKEAADVLTGTHLLEKPVAAGCPTEKSKPETPVAGCSC
jgi:alkylhydroperoxidase/carboxymuconolactone decarboxylase family protein YurZ